ncbi:MAG: anhydro-N-acetylmuramic acid kinase [Candidatus Hydrogenedentota bacterium]
MRQRFAAGCMSGTSLDGIDAALVRITGEGLGMTAETVRCASRPLEALGDALRPLAEQRPVNAREFARLALELGEAHAELLAELAGNERVGLVAVHGQTVFHDPPLSMQLINPHPIVRRTGAPVVFDLRGASLAAGGQGAPITPLADNILFGRCDEARAVVNLGGFANFTWLPSFAGDEEAALRAIRGGDICACNQLLDAIARRCFQRPYDTDGQRACQGQINEAARRALLPMLQRQASAGRSLGSGDELADWTGGHGAVCPGDDLARTAAAAIAQVIAASLGKADRIILAGGGALNQALWRELSERANAPVVRSDDFGVPAQHREAIAMAVLGALCADGAPITLPQVTGCPRPAPIAGCWAYP